MCLCVAFFTWNNTWTHRRWPSKRWDAESLWQMPDCQPGWDGNGERLCDFTTHCGKKMVIDKMVVSYHKKWWLSIVIYCSKASPMLRKPWNIVKADLAPRSGAPTWSSPHQNHSLFWRWHLRNSAQMSMFWADCWHSCLFQNTLGHFKAKLKTTMKPERVEHVF